MRKTAGYATDGFAFPNRLTFEESMSIRRFVSFATLAVLCFSSAAAAPSEHAPYAKPVVTVYKDPSCGCCKNWIEHLLKHGFRVDAKDTPDLSSVKQAMGVPDRLHSCHTAVVAGYLIEGHVPAEDIDRLLTQKPKIRGLAVPGMPMGSPGMEGPTRQAFAELAFDASGKTQVFARH